jgi:hypothetical protein
MREVRAAPNQEMAADWWVSPWGRGVAMAEVENKPRATVARSPAWKRGGSLGYARRRVRGKKRGRGAAVGSFEVEAGEAGER